MSYGMYRGLILAIAATLSAGALSAERQAELPDTPAGRMFKRVLAVINGDDPTEPATFVRTNFSPDALSKASVHKRTQTLSKILRENEGYDPLFEAPGEGNDDYRLRMVVKNRKNGSLKKLRVEVERDSPDKCLEVSLRPTQLGSDAPDVTFLDTANRQVRLRDLRGSFVVLDFWATWCAPCLTLMPELQRLHEAFRGRGVKVLAVNVWEDKGVTRHDPEGYMALNGLAYELMFASDAAAQAFGLRSLPMLCVLDRDGKFIYLTHEALRGHDHADEIRKLLSTLLSPDR